MPRIITKELAEKIVAKLGAVKTKAGKAHDHYDVLHEGRIVATTSIRRGSEKDLGHDHLPRDLHIGPAKAKLLGQCPLTRDGYIDLLRERGLVAPAEEA